ncbi:Uncharacterised protein [Zhongshania aliphaticivorans]|uniref:DUF2889 domain-containing protein n=1 Tax=Zhongshania aliphaticivorans TaxID=1470434 RepID=A0A5S9MR87_9GAMM|nr:DUF2889 domain-containing protein [Zhongshania aliphaticivorans]CAA0079047.1 Uncharacterised protein [Zhongshania aliphaticivorans]CAA0086389.1 Uncharacterised protein [Zhongshania aliphaticivorans]
MSTTADYPENPDYGRGRYRRRIRLSNNGMRVYGELEDTHHAFRCTVSHDGHYVTDIQSDVIRIPFDTCPSASAPIRKLIGLPLCDDIQELIPSTDTQGNCTHLLDLTLMTIRHARRTQTEWLYDICIEDQLDGQAARTEIRTNGELSHSWTTLNWSIVEPEILKDKVLYKGFSKWASVEFSGDQKEAAFALQKGYFVSSARRYNLNTQAGQPAIKEAQVMQGACFTYSSPQIEVAVRTANNARDFSDTPEQLLTFQEPSKS